MHILHSSINHKPAFPYMKGGIIMDDVPVMLTVKEAAETFGIAQHHARMLALSGAVAATRAGRSKILINKGSLIDYFNNCTLSDGANSSDFIEPIPSKLR